MKTNTIVNYIFWNNSVLCRVGVLCLPRISLLSSILHTRVHIMDMLTPHFPRDKRVRIASKESNYICMLSYNWSAWEHIQGYHSNSSMLRDKEVSFTHLQIARMPTKETNRPSCPILHISAKGEAWCWYSGVLCHDVMFWSQR